MFELGLWKGGSMAFWAEAFRPARLVGSIDGRRAGPPGLYVIEDWSWHHWPAYREIFARQVPLTRLMTELIEAVGTGSDMIADVSVYQGFAAVRRRPAPASTPFRLTEAIFRGAPAPVSLRKIVRDLRHEVGVRLRRGSIRSG